MSNKIKRIYRNEVINQKSQYHNQILSRKGIGKDMRRAVNMYKMAAEKGNATAQYKYGYCLFNGEGVEKVDKEEAIKWVKKAANQGNYNATEFLELMNEVTTY